MAAPQRPRPRPRPQLARTNAMKHSYPAEDEGPAAELGSEFASQTSFRIRCGRGAGAEVADLFRKLGLSGPEDFTIPPAIYAAAMAYLPDLSRRRRESLEASLGRGAGAEGSASPELPDVSGRDVVVAARLDTAELREEPVLATKVVKAEVVEVSARSYEGDGAESSSRVVELEVAEASRREVATVVKAGNADKEKTRLSSSRVNAVKVDPLRVERRKPVVVEAIRETTGVVVQVVAESTSCDIEHLISPSPHRRFKRTITSWLKGGHLGSGSFGSVYEAISDDGFFFAVKEVSLLDQGLNAKQRICQLEHEISLLSRLEHENIVRYFGTDKEDGKLYIFLELVTQGSLAALYQKYRLQDSQVSAYTRQILNGLSYLHQRNVLHRDIKCANILVDANGLVKLADFGLAKEMSILSQARSSKGTVYWMAPEVAKAKPHGPPADIWSLGCTVLEMLTGRVPYPDMEWTYALLKIGRGIPPEIPNTLSEDAHDFIMRCVQANPDDRPSAAQLLEHPFVQRPLQH
ncbi:mitogen-activated protein kinase kinase kinase 1a-like [Phragmites australis]|uniref:mitogen-activated protein kinase kinase kinase 1a-like n=1 Tax=Phragmites australis TaxID=29695 RepID=UPI002D79F635|nr:mitogen-activated protein kinase kinase kinase 1a-like [Phragmites australis]